MCMTCRDGSYTGQFYMDGTLDDYYLAFFQTFEDRNPETVRNSQLDFPP